MSFFCSRAIIRHLCAYIRNSVTLGLIAILAGCAVNPPAPAVSAPVVSAPEELVRVHRIARIQANLNEGLKQYEAGSYEEAFKNLLIALDSGILTVPEQLRARKHVAFIQCVNNRELVCKEEFEKAFVLDPAFDLTPAEAGHPTWGPIFRLVKTEIESRKSGKPLPAPVVRLPLPGEKLFTEAMKSYDDADYPKAVRLFQESLKVTHAPAEQILIHKFTAFSYCLTNRQTLCRAEFEKILQLNPAFELDAAEAGHPSWGPPFRTVKAKQKPASAKK
ncbi:MAG: TssQ family T6SS-associated lipoprotein [Betaproteobacteria bacterium]|nr:TssQ family T6SS-associated lipoprotein [Betaproteobacteria bacterium]